MSALFVSDANPRMVIVSCVAGSLVVLLFGFLWRVAKVRKVVWIAARPQVEPASVNRMPEGIRQTVARVTPPLTSLSFTIAENVQAPHFSKYVFWSQVLFVNRATGDRASVIGRQQFYLETITFAFATELHGGPRIVTGWDVAKNALFDRSAPNLNRLDIPTLYGQHRERVAEALKIRSGEPSEATPGILPKEGEELEWLNARAGLVAAGIAGKLGYRLDPNGDYFRPPWRLAARLALTKSLLSAGHDAGLVG